MDRLPAPKLPRWIARMLPEGIERYRVDVGGQLIHVMEAGRGRPVLMLHGNPTWGFLYRKVVAELDLSRFRVILPDLVGFGLSSMPPDGRLHTLDSHIGWLGRLIDRLDLRELVFVGHDWGGPIGFGALATRRERCAGLVVLNTVIGPPDASVKSSIIQRFARLPVIGEAAFRLMGFPQRLLGRAQGKRSSIRGRVARAYRWPLRDLRNNVGPLALARMVPTGPRHPTMVQLRRVQAFIDTFEGPSAIVWGDRDPILGAARPWVERHLPRAAVTPTRAGHFLQEEVPDEIARAIDRVSADA